MFLEFLKQRWKVPDRATCTRPTAYAPSKDLKNPLFFNLTLKLGTARSEPLSNGCDSGSENAIRPLAAIRKGYPYCGNHESAENAAIMYSVLGCCKGSDVNPWEWLTDVFAKISLNNSTYDLDLADLLPHRWKKSNKCQSFSENSD